MPTLMPRDDDNFAIPALAMKPDCAHSVSFDAASSSRNSTAFDPRTRVVSIFATDNVFLRFGDSSVTASTSDHFFPAGIYYDVAISNVKTTHYDYIAIRGAGTSGTVYLSEKE